MFIKTVNQILFMFLQFFLIRSYNADLIPSHHRPSLLYRRSGTSNLKVSPLAPNGIDESKYQPKAISGCATPQVSKTIKVTAPTTVVAGTVFDCKFAKYQYDDASCKLDTEFGNNRAVFNLENGATLQNCFLGYSQESVHCLGECTIKNSHWSQVCDDAVMFHMKSGKATVTGCSFGNAGNKALQFNGGGTLTVENSCFSNVDIAYRSCGSGCKSRAKRSVIFKNIVIKDVNTLAGYNSKDGDTVQIISYTGKPAKVMCQAKDAGELGGKLPPGCTIAR